jgi:hypothetical protein
MAVAESRPWLTVEIEDPTFIQLGETSAAIVYRARARREGEELYEAAITSVYRWRAGRSELVLHQQTPMKTHGQPGPE